MHLASVLLPDREASIAQLLRQGILVGFSQESNPENIHYQGNCIRIFIAANVRWLCRSKCFLPPISADERGPVLQR
jgi:hypothetical protein